MVSTSRRRHCCEIQPNREERLPSRERYWSLNYPPRSILISSRTDPGADARSCGMGELCVCLSSSPFVESHTLTGSELSQEGGCQAGIGETAPRNSVRASHRRQLSTAGSVVLAAVPRLAGRQRSLGLTIFLLVNAIADDLINVVKSEQTFGGVFNLLRKGAYSLESRLQGRRNESIREIFKSICRQQTTQNENSKVSIYSLDEV